MKFCWWLILFIPLEVDGYLLDALDRFFRARHMDRPPVSDYSPISTTGKVPLEPQRSEVRIAFVADTGMNMGARRLWRYLKQNADAVVHPGDFAYEYKGAQEFTQIFTSIFGADFPYITTMGDHDVQEFEAYRHFFTTRDRKIQEQGSLHCEGQWGVQTVCRFKGIVILSMGIAFKTSDYDLFISTELQKYREWPWKICSWHRVAKPFQPGSKMDSIDPYFYELCRKNGAFIVTGHEHQYARSHTMNSFIHPRRFRPTSGVSNNVVVGQGQSFFVLSGLGGALPRPWTPSKLKDPWWAAVVSKQNMVESGALICTFRLQRNDHLAFCEFKDSTGLTMDRFSIESQEGRRSEVDRSLPTSGSFYDPVAAKKRGRTGLMTVFKKTNWFALPTGLAFTCQREALYRQASTRYAERALGVREETLDSLLSASYHYKTYPLVLKRKRLSPTSSHLTPSTEQRSTVDVVRATYWIGLQQLEDCDQQEIRLHGMKSSRLQFTGSSIGKESKTLVLEVTTSGDDDSSLHDEEDFHSFTRSPSTSSVLHPNPSFKWKLKGQQVHEAGSKAVWTSPDLSSVLRMCFEEEQSCELVLQTRGGGIALIDGAFHASSRVWPQLVVELNSKE